MGDGGFELHDTQRGNNDRTSHSQKEMSLGHGDAEEQVGSSCLLWHLEVERIKKFFISQ